jgi:hypothetical protein
VHTVGVHLSSPPPQAAFHSALNENELPGDLFSAIFKSHSYECAWRALLAHAIALQRPLLAVLAASDEVCHNCMVLLVIMIQMYRILWWWSVPVLGCFLCLAPWHLISW